VGSPIANRQRAEIEGLIGFFVNTLAMRTDLTGRPTGRELLHRVREVCLGAYAHQDVPFEILVEELGVERAINHTPLFQVMMVLQNAPSEIMEWPGIDVSTVEVEHRIAKFNLTLIVEDRGGEIKGLLEYNTDLFDEATIQRMSLHFQQLLHGIVDHPETQLSELPLMTAPERDQQLIEWNDTALDYQRHLTLHELFEAQAASTPNALAASFGQKRLTYRELHEQSNRLARHLRLLGVGRGTLVGVCIERSVEMIVGLLGILKAGGAYVPLDSSYPKGG